MLNKFSLSVPEEFYREQYGKCVLMLGCKGLTTNHLVTASPTILLHVYLLVGNILLFFFFVIWEEIVIKLLPSFWVYNLLHIFVFDPVGVVFASISSGFGEITLLSYSAHFDKWVMSISSTGTRHKQTPLWCIKRHIRS